MLDIFLSLRNHILKGKLNEASPDGKEEIIDMNASKDAGADTKIPDAPEVKEEEEQTDNEEIESGLKDGEKIYLGNSLHDHFYLVMQDDDLLCTDASGKVLLSAKDKLGDEFKPEDNQSQIEFIKLIASELKPNISASTLERFKFFDVPEETEPTMGEETPVLGAGGDAGMPATASGASNAGNPAPMGGETMPNEQSVDIEPPAKDYDPITKEAGATGLDQLKVDGQDETEIPQGEAVPETPKEEQPVNPNDHEDQYFKETEDFVHGSEDWESDGEVQPEGTPNPAFKGKVSEAKGNHTTGAQRYNKRMDKIWADAKAKGALSDENLAKARKGNEELKKEQEDEKTLDKQVESKLTEAESFQIGDEVTIVNNGGRIGEVGTIIDHDETNEYYTVEFEDGDVEDAFSADLQRVGSKPIGADKFDFGGRDSKFAGFSFGNFKPRGTPYQPRPEEVVKYQSPKVSMKNVEVTYSVDLDNLNDLYLGHGGEGDVEDALNAYNPLATKLARQIIEGEMYYEGIEGVVKSVSLRLQSGKHYSNDATLNIIMDVLDAESMANLEKSKEFQVMGGRAVEESLREKYGLDEKKAPKKEDEEEGNKKDVNTIVREVLRGLDLSKAYSRKELADEVSLLTKDADPKVYYAVLVKVCKKVRKSARKAKETVEETNDSERQPMGYEQSLEETLKKLSDKFIL